MMKRVLPVLLILWMLTNVTLAQQLTLDGSFGDNGIVIKTLNGDALPFAVACQTDGKLIVAGYHGWFMSQWSVVSRFNSDGSVDSDFGVSGSAETGLTPSEYQEFEDVVVQPDNKAIAVGPLDDSTGEFYLFAARFSESGQPDSSFNNDGLALLGKGTLHSIALLPNGKVVMGGGVVYGQNNRFTLLQCKSNGTLDSSFGTNGMASIDLGVNTKGEILDVVIQSDGKILTTGSRDTILNFGGTLTNYLMARFNTNGSLDSTFGINGLVKNIPIYPKSFLGLQKNGKILLGSFPGLICYNPNGTVDSTFGIAGKLNEQCLAVGVDSSNRIILVGQHFIAPDYKFKVYVFDSSAALLDTLVTDFVGDNEANALCFQPDGKMVVLGRTYRGVTGSFPAFMLARYYYGINNRVEDVTQGIAITALPNPFSTQLTFSLADNVPTTVSLYNFLGQQVLQRPFTNSTTINTDQLADGIYFYELRSSKGTLKTGKLVKQ